MLVLRYVSKLVIKSTNLPEFFNNTSLLSIFVGNFSLTLILLLSATNLDIHESILGCYKVLPSGICVTLLPHASKTNNNPEATFGAP